jgi:hypothetical protein
MKKIIMWVSVLCVLWLWVFVWLKNNNLADTVNANPDYICKKSVTGSPCNVTNYPSSCSPWTAAWTRTCPWLKTTEVSYYLVRTDCEAWYTKVAHGDSWADSWRQWADWVSGSENCTITESDHVSPTWKID